jgi:hypothetical protein
MMVAFEAQKQFILMMSCLLFCCLCFFCHMEDLCWCFNPQVLQDQVDELQSELEEYRAQGKVFRHPLKNSLSEEFDVNGGAIEPDQGKRIQTPSFQSLMFDLCF